MQLWVTDPHDADGRDQMTVCVRLIVEGAAAVGVSVFVDRSYGSERRPTRGQSTGVEGVASFIFYTGGGSDGVPSLLEAVASYRGMVYQATLAPS
jgi:hypothetical protein